MKNKILLFAILMSLICIPGILAYTINFNGEFKQGTTLYSDTYNINSYFQGKDVYKIKNSILNKVVCKNETITYYNYSCENKSIGYKYVYVNGIKTKVIIYSIVCSNKKVIGLREVCKNVSSPIICYNPITHANTNQLSLTNFEYSLDEINWIRVPYSRLYINNTDIRFRVNIPSQCSPVYDINNSISILGE
jgi:hypothetical protein